MRNTQIVAKTLKIKTHFWTGTIENTCIIQQIKLRNKYISKKENEQELYRVIRGNPSQRISIFSLLEGIWSDLEPHCIGALRLLNKTSVIKHCEFEIPTKELVIEHLQNREISIHITRDTALEKVCNKNSDELLVKPGSHVIVLKADCFIHCGELVFKRSPAKGQPSKLYPVPLDSMSIVPRKISENVKNGSFNYPNLLISVTALLMTLILCIKICLFKLSSYITRRKASASNKNAKNTE